MVLVTKSYICLKSEKLEFYVGRDYFNLLRAALDEAENMKMEN
jgi:hypothetical protein